MIYVYVHLCENLLKMWPLEFQCGFLKMTPGSHSGFLKLTSSAHRAIALYIMPPPPPPLLRF